MNSGTEVMDINVRRKLMNIKYGNQRHYSRDEAYSSLSDLMMGLRLKYKKYDLDTCFVGNNNGQFRSSLTTNERPVIEVGVQALKYYMKNDMARDCDIVIAHYEARHEEIHMVQYIRQLECNYTKPYHFDIAKDRFLLYKHGDSYYHKHYRHLPAEIESDFYGLPQTVADIHEHFPKIENPEQILIDYINSSPKGEYFTDIPVETFSELLNGLKYNMINCQNKDRDILFQAAVNEDYNAVTSYPGILLNMIPSTRKKAIMPELNTPDNQHTDSYDY